MSTLYLTDIRNLPEDLSSLLPLLSSGRRRRLGLLADEKSRRRCIAAGLLLRRVQGRDEVVLQGGSPFSLAHSGDRVVLAVAQGPVGVDIEQHRPLRFLALTTRFFAPSERALVNSPADFFGLWTAKEALAKMLGVGMARTMRRYTLERSEGGFTCPAFPDLTLLTLPLLPGYSLTLCGKEPYDGQIERVDFVVA